MQQVSRMVNSFFKKNEKFFCRLWIDRDFGQLELGP